MRLKIKDLAKEILERTEPIPFSGCWIWLGHVHKKSGYGYIAGGNLVHRVAYEKFVGPIPDGLTIDHKCRVRSCCNPHHLEPVTHQTNISRGNSPSALVNRTGFCALGLHPFIESNIIIVGSKRRCKACADEYQRLRTLNMSVEEKAFRAQRERNKRAAKRAAS